MGGEHDKLKLGKGVLFVKSQIRRLVQDSDTWEADFMAVPKPVMQTATHYLGLVVTHPDGIRLASQPVEQAPTVNDLANLLAKAMRRPLIEGPHRPRCILLRRNPRWKQLFPPLKELEIEVVIQNELPNVTAAFEKCLSRLKDARSAGRIKPTVEQAKVERMFPAIAKWVQGYGHIEIGDQESFGFVVRALDYGGLVFENDKADTLTEAMAALETGLAEYFQREGIEWMP